MAPPNNDSDCPIQTLWKFPAPGDKSMMPDECPQSSSFHVEEYLEQSAHDPPTSGFGVVPLYVNDVVEGRWVLDFEGHTTRYQNLYCKDCEQKISDYEAHKDFDWKSCYARPGRGGIWSTSFPVKGTSMSKVPVKFDFTAGTDTMVCAFGFPGTQPGGLSQVFPVINGKPPPGRGRHIFTSEGPEGVPYKGCEAASLWMYGIIGGVLVVCMVFFARLLVKKRKQRKLSQALMAQSVSGGLLHDGNTRYTDGL